MDARREVGRLGDFVDFRDFPDGLATEVVATAFDAGIGFQSLGPKVVCGSPFEVANDPTNYGEMERGAFGAFLENNSTVFNELRDQSLMTWMEIALKGGDNLRQRVAWTLSQILAVSPDSIEAEVTTEPWLVRRRLPLFIAMSCISNVLLFPSDLLRYLPPACLRQL